MGLFPHHGIALPLFSLRSNRSCGIGEFLDLIELIDWCKAIGFDVIQLLPLNDSGEDTSPYNPLSSCALDPIYLSLHALPNAPPLPRLPDRDRLARSEVKREKLRWLASYFQKAFSKTHEYEEFLSTHPWLPSYCRLSDQEQFASFLQFLSASQMKKVRSHAAKQGVFLQGDLPISLSPNSADVLSHPSLFNLEFSAGAPPDFYTPFGQKWGFPLFNWEAMRNENFRWWKERFSFAEELYHLYRIDHVVGLFRIWAIPREKKPWEGSFLPSDSRLWEEQGRSLLEMMLDSCSLLPIAEDLGVIPKEVRPILKELGICRTIVPRWERRFEEDASLIPHNAYDPFSVTTVSTADSDILRAWWGKNPEEAKEFSHLIQLPYQSELCPDALFSILSLSHRTPSLFHINLLQEYLSLFPELSFSNPEEERINTPGTLSEANWTYRFRPSLEEIIHHAGLFDAMRQFSEPAH